MPPVMAMDALESLHVLFCCPRPPKRRREPHRGETPGSYRGQCLFRGFDTSMVCSGPHNELATSRPRGPCDEDLSPSHYDMASGDIYPSVMVFPSYWASIVLEILSTFSVAHLEGMEHYFSQADGRALARSSPGKYRHSAGEATVGV
jgi:hypothetical protein